MRFIHTADLHLASKLSSRFTPEKARLRRRELLETFRRIADKAIELDARGILLSGDIFDEEKPPERTVKQFLDVVRSHPGIDFLCLAGNHDESLAQRDDLPENLLTFDEEWKKYSYGDVEIHGVELSRANCDLIYSSLRTDPDKINIVMLHGQLAESAVAPDEQTVILPRLAGKGIDYLALGHIHSYKTGSLDRRGTWCYCGTPEGRGFDECGEKGVVLLDCEAKNVKCRFLPVALRTIRSISCDLTGAEGVYDVEKRVEESLSGIPEKDLVQLRLTGSLPPQTHISPSSVSGLLERRFFGYEVKNALKTAIDPEEYRDLLSLNGEFVRLVMGEDLPEEDKNRIIRCGLLALMGEEVDEV